jgi:hypothetical protein
MILIKWFRKLFGLNKVVIFEGKSLTEILEEKISQNKKNNNDTLEEIEI